MYLFITVSMWSFHDRLLLTVTPSSLAVDQDLITESWYRISGLYTISMFIKASSNQVLPDMYVYSQCLSL